MSLNQYISKDKLNDMIAKVLDVRIDKATAMMDVTGQWFRAASYTGKKNTDFLGIFDLRTRSKEDPHGYYLKTKEAADSMFRVVKRINPDNVAAIEDIKAQMNPPKKALLRTSMCKSVMDILVREDGVFAYTEISNSGRVIAKRTLLLDDYENAFCDGGELTEFRILLTLFIRMGYSFDIPHVGKVLNGHDTLLQMPHPNIVDHVTFHEECHPNALIETSYRKDTLDCVRITRAELESVMCRHLCVDILIAKYYLTLLGEEMQDIVLANPAFSFLGLVTATISDKRTSKKRMSTLVSDGLRKEMAVTDHLDVSNNNLPNAIIDIIRKVSESQADMRTKTTKLKSPNFGKITEFPELVYKIKIIFYSLLLARIEFTIPNFGTISYRSKGDKCCLDLDENLITKLTK